MQMIRVMNTADPATLPAIIGVSDEDELIETRGGVVFRPRSLAVCVEVVVVELTGNVILGPGLGLGLEL